MASIWFIREVLPLIEQALGWETRLTVAGHTDASVSLEPFREHPRVTLRGAVADTGKLYDAHRIFVAPTRYAAGMPYKVHEAASFGIPVVATELLRRQLGWEDGRELLSVDAGDPAAFAGQLSAVPGWRVVAVAARQRAGSRPQREFPRRVRSSDPQGAGGLIASGCVVLVSPSPLSSYSRRRASRPETW